MRSVLKLKNYEIHSITTAFEGKSNANIATWVMQSALKARYVTVAFFKEDLTLELALKSRTFNINLLSVNQIKLINRLGRESGRDLDKLQNIPHKFDDRGVPFLTESVGFVKAKMFDFADSGDHLIISAMVVGQHVLNPKEEILRKANLVKKA